VTGAPHHDRSDDELVAAAVRGDTGAFGELVARYQRSARGLAASLVGSSDADDVAQDAFLRAYRSLSSFRRGSAFRPWLLTIVAHQAANHHRSSSRRNRRQAFFGRRAVPVDDSPAELTVRADEQRRLRAALNTMATKDRDVLIFRFLLDYSEEETAMALDCAPGTVKSRTSRALAKLRAQPVFATPEDLDA
jgi:RNA polymerase sigma factor (sigma-70 family)